MKNHPDSIQNVELVWDCRGWHGDEPPPPELYSLIVGWRAIEQQQAQDASLDEMGLNDED